MSRRILGEKMKPNYKLKHCIPSIFVVLEPHQYKIVHELGNCLFAKVQIEHKRRSEMLFLLSKKGKFFINSGKGKLKTRKNEKGEFVTYAIPAI